MIPLSTVLAWVAGISFVLALALGGVLNSGDRIRANYHTEQPSDRQLRMQGMLVCLGISLVTGLLALALR